MASQANIAFNVAREDVFSTKTVEVCPEKICFMRVKMLYEGKMKQTHAWPMYMQKQTIKAVDAPKISFEITEGPIIKVSNAEGAGTALFLTLESGSIPGYFSDNVFFLLPGESESVTFIPKFP